MHSPDIRPTIPFLLLVCLLILPAAGSLALAQEFRGTITGSVQDPSGGMIPGAGVSVTHVETGQTMKLTTNDSGQFVAPLLVPGMYRLEVEMPGFKKFLRAGIELRVNDRLQVDVALEIGEMTQTVTVTAGAPLLETTEGSSGWVVDSKRLSELPIAHGNPYLLIGMAPGTTMEGDQKLNRPYEPTHIVGYSMTGARSNTSDVTLDGVANTAIGNPGQVTASYVPPVDAISEFKVQTAAFDVKVGQTSGGVVNISLKSGTNALHGTGYYTKMAPWMTANDFFANRAGVPRGPFTYDRWGASLNGPVVLPKLYDGHGKTFFMVAYEGLKDSRPRGNTYTVPTLKERDGDFSELLALGSRYQIYNPFTRRREGSRYRQDPFVNNIIPATLQSPVARKVMEYVPKPINDGTTADHVNNLPRPNLIEATDYFTWVGRVDHTFSSKHRFFMRANMYNRDSFGDDYYETEATGRRQQFLSRGASADDVYTLSPTLIMNFRYGYNRYIRLTLPKNGWGFDLTTLGFPASLNNAVSPDIRMFPQFRIRESGTLDSISTLSLGEDRNMDTHSFVAAFTKMRGVHQYEFGMEFRSYRHNRYQVQTANSGSYQFDRTYTRGPLDNAAESPFGQGMASFLLGIASTNSQLTRTSNFAEQSTAWSFYLQDSWRVSRRFNLSFGLRYELETPLTERFDRSVRGFDTRAVPAAAAGIEANYAKSPTLEIPAEQFKIRGGLTFAGVNGLPRELWDTDKNNFMPRFSFAYSLRPRTVLRGGYGIFYGFLGARRTDVVQTGWARNTPLVPTSDSGLTFRAKLENPFPDGILEPVGSGLGIETELGNSITFFNARPLAPYMQRWQLGLQHELPHRVVVEINYVGSRGLKLETTSSTRDLNAIPQKYLSKSMVRDQASIDYLSANLTNPFNKLIAGTVGQNTTISRANLLRPYPHFSSSMRSQNNDGSSWYHGLQARADKRFSAGLALQTAYTWSKFMEAVDYLNPGDDRPNYCISPQDRTHRVTASSIYEIPVGKRRRFLSGANTLVDRLLGGWQVQAIYTFQSGAPLTWSSATTVFNGNFADITAGEKSIDSWFNTEAGFLKDTALAPNSTYQLRFWPLRFGHIRSDSTNNWDMSLTKNFRIREGVRVQLRAEFLNAFNHASFRAPTTDPYNRAFGQVTDTAAYARQVQVGVKAIF